MTPRESIIRCLNTFCMFFCVVLLEEIFVGTNVTYSMISCVLCIIGIMIYLRMNNKSLEGLGFIFSGNKIIKGFLLAAITAIVSISIVVLLEEGYYRSLGNSGWYFKLTQTLFFYRDKNSVLNEGVVNWAKWMLIGVLVSLIRACFFETFFRGLLIRLNAKGLGFNGANLMQTVLFVAWFSVVPLKNFIGKTNKDEVISAGIILLLYIVYEFIVAFRLGLFRRATGSLWVCIFSYWFFDFFNNCFYSLNYFPGNMGVYSKIIRGIAVQLVALIITVIYYKVKMKQVNKSLSADDNADEFLDDAM